MLRTFSLPNGIRVATYHMPTVKSLHIGMSVKGGSVVENKEDSGLAHFMEHMLVQGSPSYPTAQLLSSHIESLAGRYGASTSRFIVHFFLSVPYSELEDALNITAETFFEPLFPPEAIEKEREAVLNELKQHMDSRWYNYNKFVRESRYTKNSLLQQETIGKEEIIRRLTREDLMNYWKEYFVPENMYLFIGGNFDPDTLEKVLSSTLGKKKSQKNPQLPTLTNHDLSERKVALRHDNEFQMDYLDLSFPAINLFTPIKENLIQNVALIILGQLRTSRLFRLLRYEKGLVYGVNSDDIFLLGAGMVSITSEVAPEHLDEVISLITKELRGYIDHGPTEEELKFVQHFLTNRWLMAFDNPSTIQGWVENDFLWKDKIRMPEEYIELLNKITRTQITELMQEKWDLSKLNLIIQGQLDESEQMVKKYEDMIGSLR